VALYSSESFLDHRCGNGGVHEVCLFDDLQDHRSKTIYVHINLLRAKIVGGIIEILNSASEVSLTIPLLMASSLATSLITSDNSFGARSICEVRAGVHG
jgi:hypothetical protein